MRVLFVPLHSGGLPHCGPLIALSRRCAGIETAFLLPRPFHVLREAAGVNVLPVDYQNTMRSELEAYRVYRPDIVVDDCSVTTHYARAIWEIPRVSVVRTGTFEGYVPKHLHHQFSLRIDLERQEPAMLQHLGLQPLEQVADFFRGDVYIVPGVPAIERVPDVRPSDSPHVHSGPLLLDDDLIERIVNATEAEAMSRTALERFCDSHDHRPIAFFTFGNVHAPTGEIRQCMRHLLNRGIAVIATIPLDDVPDGAGSLYHYAPYVPMHYVTRRANLMVHQCGSATYHYGLLHETPVVTVGSRCFDRDDVATRLEELGVSRHVADPADEPDFVAVLLRLCEGALEDRERPARLAAVRAIKDEIARTRESFDLPAALALARTRYRARRSSGPTLSRVARVR